MPEVKAYAALNHKDPLKPFTITRRNLGKHDVDITIDYCGICHSDLHQIRNEWNKAIFPLVPGHEILGTVKAIGNEVSLFKVGDRVGVGVFINSCRECEYCKAGLQQYCESGMVQTYNAYEKDSDTPTYGGYSKSIVVDENYIFRIPENLSVAGCAPLLCAGITTYSPLKHWQIKKGDKVGVMGLGGLGHMAVKFANALGAEVTVFSTSDSKKVDAKRMGATHVVNTKKEKLEPLNKTFDLLINTISANIDLDSYLELLKTDGTMVMVGAPEHPTPISAFPLIMGRRSLAGSLIGGIKEIQEMLDFCGKHNITADVEVIAPDEINTALDRLLKGDVKYRFVIDMSKM